jgi:hypothetical protein
MIKISANQNQPDSVHEYTVKKHGSPGKSMNWVGGSTLSITKADGKETNEESKNGRSDGIEILESKERSEIHQVRKPGSSTILSVIMSSSRASKHKNEQVVGKTTEATPVQNRQVIYKTANCEDIQSLTMVVNSEKGVPKGKSLSPTGKHSPGKKDTTLEMNGNSKLSYIAPNEEEGLTSKVKQATFNKGQSSPSIPNLKKESVKKTHQGEGIVGISMKKNERGS